MSYHNQFLKTCGHRRSLISFIYWCSFSLRYFLSAFRCFIPNFINNSYTWICDYSFPQKNAYAIHSPFFIFFRFWRIIFVSVSYALCQSRKYVPFLAFHSTKIIVFKDFVLGNSSLDSTAHLKFSKFL